MCKKALKTTIFDDKQAVYLTNVDNFFIIEIMEQNDRLTIKAKEVISSPLKAKLRVAVAVSGGKDSTCLLHFLLNNYDKNLLSVVHIEHGIRGEQSAHDAEFVKALCLKAGVEFALYEADIPAMAKESGRSEESEARLFRKKVFTQVIAQGKADLIALAHHELDQAETVLMHIFRGSGVNGLKGMSARDGFIIRPFIDVTKDEIDDYVNKNQIAFRQDDTNFEDKYNRNFVRNQVIPLISQRYDVVSGALRLSKSAGEDEDFISSFVNEDLIVLDGLEVSLPVDALKNHYAVASRYVILALKRAGLTSDLEKKHVEAVIALADKQSGSEVCLPHGYVATLDYGRVSFGIKEEQEFDSVEFAVGITSFGNGYVSVTSGGEIQKGSLVFDGDKIPDGTVIRHRCDGDKFTPYGGGMKKLKEYLIDKKIPRRKRDALPLVCYEDKVLVVVGVEISDSVKITGSTVNRLKITYEED